jgi:hypothetical protein
MGFIVLIRLRNNLGTALSHYNRTAHSARPDSTFPVSPTSLLFLQKNPSPCLIHAMVALKFINMRFMVKSNRVVLHLPASLLFTVKYGTGPQPTASTVRRAPGIAPPHMRACSELIILDVDRPVTRVMVLKCASRAAIPSRSRRSCGRAKDKLWPGGRSARESSNK